ncbi:TPA: anti-adapter protein iraM [Citrobacter freundii]
MNWDVEKTMVCPDTGTTFSLARSVKNLQVILWYKGCEVLQTGSVIATSPFGLFVDGNTQRLQLLHVFPYSPHLWSSVIKHKDCPGNFRAVTGCSRFESCRFKRCPYGASPVLSS